MAPPKRTIPRVQIAVRLEPEVLAKIDAWAAFIAHDGSPRPSRDKLITHAVVSYLEGYEKSSDN